MLGEMDREQPPVAGAAPVKRIRRLTVERYGHIASCDLRFGNGLNLLLGKNGTGKTTLLHILSAILRDDFSRLAPNADISWEVDSAAGPAEFSIRPARSAELNAQLRLPGDPAVWRTWTAQGWGKSISSTDEDPRGAPWVRLVMEGGTPVIERLTERGQFAISPDRLDEGLDAFETFARIRHERQGALLARFGGPWMLLPSNVPFPRFAVPQADAPPERLELSSADDPVLRLACTAFGVESARIRCAQLRLNESQDAASVTAVYAMPEFDFLLADGSKFTHSDLSFGEKRFLMFLYFALSAPALPFVADELTNGFHHAWIEIALEILRGNSRQSFIATQNPLLIDQIDGVDGGEEGANRLITCRRAIDGETRRAVWSNLTPDETRRFSQLYNAGIGAASEALRDAGLW